MMITQWKTEKVERWEQGHGSVWKCTKLGKIQKMSDKVKHFGLYFLDQISIPKITIPSSDISNCECYFWMQFSVNADVRGCIMHCISQIRPKIQIMTCNIVSVAERVAK